MRSHMHITPNYRFDFFLLIFLLYTAQKDVETDVES